MMIVFADTFYYIAFLSPSDEAHDQAKAFTKNYSGKMITTEWVLTELADGLAAPFTRQRCVAFIDWLRGDADVTIVPAATDLFNAGLSLYRSRDDKKWSLTDCVSFIVMEREGIRDVLTGNHNFEQAGFTALLR
jgi:predicted nucleic acid-binding protein